jgi:DnaK suppressor protein
MKKDFISNIEKKLKEEEKHLITLLSSFARKNPKLSQDWQTKFPDFTQSLEESCDEVEEYLNLLPIEKKLEIKLLDVRRALEKIKRKKYGFCEICGKRISQKRLKVLPHTKFCSNCAKKILY